jgi:hypothetical protein
LISEGLAVLLLLAMLFIVGDIGGVVVLYVVQTIAYILFQILVLECLWLLAKTAWRVLNPDQPAEAKGS